MRAGYQEVGPQPAGGQQQHLLRHAAHDKTIERRNMVAKAGQESRIHVGAMAGTIDLIQRCFIGIEMRANALHFDPALPDDLRQIKVRLRYRRQVLDIEVDHDTLRIGSRSFTSVPIKVAYRGHYRDLAPGEVCQFRLLKPEDRDRDENRTMGAAKEAKR